MWWRLVHGLGRCHRPCPRCRRTAGLFLFVALVAAGCAAPLETRIRLAHDAGRLPRDVTIPGESHADLWAPLVAYAASKGFAVVKREDLTGYGLTNFFTQEISISPAYPMNTQVATLVHEIGHTSSPRSFSTRPYLEMWAETIDFLVCEALGLDIAPQSWSYVANNVDPVTRAFVLERYGDQLRAEAKAIVRFVRRYR